MKQINVALAERSYTITVLSGSLSSSGDYVAELLAGRKVLVISDSTVAAEYGDAVCKSLRGSASEVNLAKFPAGEASKTLSTVESILHRCVEFGLDRGSVVLALGGGVPGDIAGFVAAIYMRGISFIQLPTSLLAMVDSSVGGKTGVDLAEGKNLVGAFWQPQGVLIDPEVLRTLPLRELRCGLAEVVKYGMIFDSEFFSELETHVTDLLALELTLYGKIIARCCELKAQVVSEDEREGGRRALLNYGHTFGHALEVVTGYGRYAHGEAVAVGMGMAADFAVNCGMLERADVERQDALLSALGLPIRADSVDAASLLKAMGRDKKVCAGGIRLVLPKRIGMAELISGSDSADILAAIRGRCD